MYTPSAPKYLFSHPFIHTRFEPETSAGRNETVGNCWLGSWCTDVSRDHFDSFDAFQRVLVQEYDDLPPIKESVYEGSLLIRAHRVFGHRLLSKTSNKLTLRKLGLPTQMKPEYWYDLCIPNLFQPTCYLESLLRPYEQKMKNKYVIGVHARMAGNVSEWGEYISYLSEKGLYRMIRKINAVTKKHPDYTIFVASDTLSIISLFKSLFKNVVRTWREKSITKWNHFECAGIVFVITLRYAAFDKAESVQLCGASLIDAEYSCFLFFRCLFQLWKKMNTTVRSVLSWENESRLVLSICVVSLA